MDSTVTTAHHMQPLHCFTLYPLKTQRTTYTHTNTRTHAHRRTYRMHTNTTNNLAWNNKGKPLYLVLQTAFVNGFSFIKICLFFNLRYMLLFFYVNVHIEICDRYHSHHETIHQKPTSQNNWTAELLVLFCRDSEQGWDLVLSRSSNISSMY